MHKYRRLYPVYTKIPDTDNSAGIVVSVKNDGMEVKLNLMRSGAQTLVSDILSQLERMAFTVLIAVFERN